MKILLHLRVFAEVLNTEDAEALADDLMTKLKFFCDEILRKTKPYWKIQKYYEILLQLKPHEPVKKNIKNIIEALGEGWEINQRGEEFSAIWNYDSQNKLVNPSIHWANLEIVSEGSYQGGGIGSDHP